jgi:hypothetical protein
MQRRMLRTKYTLMVINHIKLMKIRRKKNILRSNLKIKKKTTKDLMPIKNINRQTHLIRVFPNQKQKKTLHLILSLQRPRRRNNNNQIIVKTSPRV